MEIRNRSKKTTRPAAAGAALLLVSALLVGAAPAPPALDILPLSQVRAGMKGYGLTVARGQAIERFGVEVLGVVPNATPGRTSIVVRLSGLGLEESGIVAGMSGSPVYLEGKLAGAVATGWGFTKGPIGGVTPIEAMLAMADDGAASAPSHASSGSGLGAGEVLRALAASGETRLSQLSALAERLRLEPPAGGASLLSPLSSGFPVESLERYRAALPSLLPAGAPLASAPASETAIPATPVEGGSAVAALIVEGDLQLGATGTVTAVLPGGRFVAFGHPFLGMGELALPVAPAHVVSFLPNVYQSFKIASSGRPAWRLTRDRDPGVAGALDRPAPMVPVTLRFSSDGVDRTFSYRVAPHPRLLPLLVSLTTDAALTIADPTPRDRTLRFRASYETAAGPITYEDVATGLRAKELAILTASVLAGAVLDNEMESPELSAVTLDFRSQPGERRVRIVSAALSDSRVRPGETLVATVRLAERRGKEFVKTLRVPVPKQMPEGRASLVIADGGTASAMRAMLNPAEPRTLAEFRRLLGTLVPGHNLYAGIVVGGRASATGASTITSLPPTAAALLADPPDGSESLRADVPARLVSEEVLALDQPLAGSARLEFEVERPRF